MARKLQVIGKILSDGIDPEKIEQMVKDYLEENPVVPRITINGEEPDENGNFVIEIQPAPGPETDNNVVEF